QAAPAPALSPQPISPATQPSTPPPGGTPPPGKAALQPAPKPTPPPAPTSKSQPTPPSPAGSNAAKESGVDHEEAKPSAPPPAERSPARKAPEAREIIGEFLPSYDELGPLRSGQRAYVDQNATYADVPQSQGRYCIETANRDRKDGTVWFQLARGAKVF